MTSQSRMPRRQARKKGRFSEDERDERKPHERALAGIDAGTEVPLLRVPGDPLPDLSLEDLVTPGSSKTAEEEEALELSKLKFHRSRKDPFSEREQGRAGTRSPEPPTATAKSPRLPLSWSALRKRSPFAQKERGYVPTLDEDDLVARENLNEKQKTQE